MYKRDQGFTLIELMIVVAIIAILMAYALPAYRDYTVRTRLAEGTSMAAAYKLAVNEAYVRTGSLNGLNNGTNGIATASAMGDCVDSIGVADGVITVRYNCAMGSLGHAISDVDTASIVWRPQITGGSLHWVCQPFVSRPDQSPC